LFSVGSSAIEMALGAHWQALGRFRPREAWPVPAIASPLLVVSGSCSPVTAAQIDWALAHGFVGVALERGDATRARVELTAAVAAGRSVVVYSSRGGSPREPWPASELGATLGGLAREAVAKAGVRRLLIAGGDTSGYAALALGIEALEMIAPLAPGAPLCRAHAPDSAIDGLEVNFKGGQVGAPDYFGAVARGGR
jgi:uncharacterized protein YgbK (DUF1537 family)